MCDVTIFQVRNLKLLVAGNEDREKSRGGHEDKGQADVREDGGEKREGEGLENG